MKTQSLSTTSGSNEFCTGDRVDVIDRRDGGIVALGATIRAFTFREEGHALPSAWIAELDAGFGVAVACLRRSISKGGRVTNLLDRVRPCFSKSQLSITFGGETSPVSPEALSDFYVQAIRPDGKIEVSQSIIGPERLVVRSWIVKGGPLS